MNQESYMLGYANNICIRKVLRNNRERFLEDIKNKSPDVYSCFLKEFGSEAYRTSVDLYFLQCMKQLLKDGEDESANFEERNIFMRDYVKFFERYCNLCRNDLVKKELLDSAIESLKILLRSNDNFERNINVVNFSMEQSEYLLKKKIKELQGGM